MLSRQRTRGDDTRVREGNRMDNPRVHRGDRPLPECEEVCGVLRPGALGLGFERNDMPGENNEARASGAENGLRSAGYGYKALQGHHVVANDAAL